MARLYKRNDNYYVDYSYKEKRYRKSVGKDKKIAELILKDTEVKIAKGEHLGIAEPKKILFEGFVKEYLDYAKINKAQSTFQGDFKRFKANLLPYFSGKYLKEIGTSLIEQFKTMRIAKVKGSTVNRDLSLLKHFFTKAIDLEYTTNNPVKKVKFFKESQGRTRFLNPQEITTLLNNCSGILKSVVMTAIYTGMRRGEILNLKWQDVDIINKNITVTQTKNNVVRNIPIAAALFNELMQLPKHSEYVFSESDGIRYTPAKARKQLEAAVKKANLSGVNYYTLRHSFASNLAMNCVDLRTIADLLGDRTLQMVMRYSHLSRSHLQNAIGKLNENLTQNGTNMAHPNIDFAAKSANLLK
jgi:integrase